eukprot:7252328-Prymnesium_polylepis.1
MADAPGRRPDDAAAGWGLGPVGAPPRVGRARCVFNSTAFSRTTLPRPPDHTRPGHQRLIWGTNAEYHALSCQPHSSNSYPPRDRATAEASAFKRNDSLSKSSNSLNLRSHDPRCPLDVIAWHKASLASDPNSLLLRSICA